MERQKTNHESIHDNLCQKRKMGHQNLEKFDVVLEKDSYYPIFPINAEMMMVIDMEDLKERF